MRNKSRKRILHEQRLEIAKLRRELAAHKHAREFLKTAQEYELKKIEIAQMISPLLPEYMIEDVKRRLDKESTQKIIEALAQGEVVERTETEELGRTVVRYRLTVLKKRY